jgi:hypothetical protein
MPIKTFTSESPWTISRKPTRQLADSSLPCWNYLGRPNHYINSVSTIVHSPGRLAGMVGWFWKWCRWGGRLRKAERQWKLLDSGRARL